MATRRAVRWLVPASVTGLDVNARACGDPSLVIYGFRRYLRIASTNGPMSDTSQRGSSNSAASSATW